MSAWFLRIAITAAVCAPAVSSAQAQAQTYETTWLNPLGELSSSEIVELDGREPITELGRQRQFYLAGSEELGANEIRIIALGSGQPQVQSAQASACWLIEVGNGDSFIFDIGTRCTVNLSKLEVPWDRFSKVFITHLHADHIGDLPALLADGWDMGRSVPLEVWGPSGATPELGTKAMINGLLDMYRWDYVSKLGRGAMKSYTIKLHEIDYSKVQTIYDRNGVTITSWPALHTIDGPVSYSLAWKGLKIAYSGDTVPNKWFMEYAKDSDVVIHECSDPIDALIEDRGFSPEAAWMIGTTAHTQPRQVARIFSQLAPQMAVCYHYVGNGITAVQRLYKRVRDHYDGPLSIAEDLTVYNVTPEKVVVRKVVGGDYLDNLPRRYEAPDQRKLIEPAKWLEDGREDMSDLDREVLENLKPEYREKIINNVPEKYLPKGFKRNE